MPLLYTDYMNAIVPHCLSPILQPDESGIAQACAILQDEGIVALPTETVYGLAGKALSSVALSKIYEAKNRPANNPLIWHVHSLEKARSLFAYDALSIANKRRLERLARSFWPGPLTIVAQKSSSIDCALATIAVRIPQTAVTREILRRCDFPLAMPSANISTRPSPTKASHVLKTLDGRIDAILDGGDCEGGLESTVIVLGEETIKILRPGLLSAAAIEAALGETIVRTASLEDVLCSPGQAYLHYAPQVQKIALIQADDAAQFWRSDATFIGRTSTIDELARKEGPRPAPALTMALGDTPIFFAKELYQALYAAEKHKERDLVLLTPPSGDEWAAVIDRLSRAAGMR